MSERKCVVPRNLITGTVARIASLPQFVNHRGPLYDIVNPIVHAFASELSEIPVVPTDEQAQEVVRLKERFRFDAYEWVRWGAVEWQRRMFRAPEPDDTHPVLKEWMADAEKRGVDEITKANYRRLFERAFDAGRSSIVLSPAPATKPERRDIKPNRYLMATKAFHKLGDISNDTPDLCTVYAEDDENYIGMWVTGVGFFDVRFPKATTRELTDEEWEKYKKTGLEMNGQYMGTAIPGDRPKP